MPRVPHVAFFCMEFGLHESFPIYSGGLGILAGDFIKSARDLKRPVVAVGLRWDRGYCVQRIRENGEPFEEFPGYDHSFLRDTRVRVRVRVRGKEVPCIVWVTERFGHVPLHLIEPLRAEDRWITHRLYESGSDVRIAQELLLGIGGLRALNWLGIPIATYHFNEGHAVFAGAEMIAERMEAGMTFEDAWADAGGGEPTDDSSLAVQTAADEPEGLLHRDHVFFHPCDLADLHDFPGPVAQPLEVDDDVYSARNLRPNRSHGQVETRHQDQGLDSRQHVSRLVGVKGGHRPVVSGIHRLQHVEGFWPTDLTDDQTVWPHTQRRDDQVADADLFAVGPGWTSFESSHVALAQLQLGRILDGDDAFIVGQVARKHVEQRGLAAARASADDYVGPREHARFQET